MRVQEALHLSYQPEEPGMALFNPLSRNVLQGEAWGLVGFIAYSLQDCRGAGLAWATALLALQAASQQVARAPDNGLGESMETLSELRMRMACTEANLACALTASGAISEAQAAFQRSLEVLELVVGSGNPLYDRVTAMQATCRALGWRVGVHLGTTGYAVAGRSDAFAFATGALYDTASLAPVAAATKKR